MVSVPDWYPRVVGFIYLFIRRTCRKNLWIQKSRIHRFLVVEELYKVGRKLTLLNSGVLRVVADFGETYLVTIQIFDVIS